MDKAADIVHERSDHRGAFVMFSNGNRMAELTYTIAGSYIILDHTHVDDALRGTGTGGKLVKAAVPVALQPGPVSGGYRKSM